MIDVRLRLSQKFHGCGKESRPVCKASIVSLLGKRKQYNEINGKPLVKEEVLFGVPHASILGPRQKTILISDVPAVIAEGEATLFAGDTSIY